MFAADHENHQILCDKIGTTQSNQRKVRNYGYSHPPQAHASVTSSDDLSTLSYEKGVTAEKSKVKVTPHKNFQNLLLTRNLMQKDKD